MHQPDKRADSGQATSTGTVALLGVPWDRGSSFLSGAARAPAAIRKALHSPSTNLTTECGLDLGRDDRFVDAGDLELLNEAEDLDEITRGVDGLLRAGSRVLSLGGDHAITYPVVRAFAGRFPGLEVIHVDAHPDLYDDFVGDRLSHACPLARILGEGLAKRVVQVGIRCANPVQREQARRFGVETLGVEDWRRALTLTYMGPVYLSIDLDGLDPAHAPGVSHPEPGGLTTRDVLILIKELDAELVGADVVELNPRQDPTGLTARVAAKLTKEIAGRMLLGNGG